MEINEVSAYNIVSSSKLVELLYNERRKEYMDRLEDMSNPKILYVTDLVSCSHRFWFRIKFPELVFSFEPVAILGGLVHRGLENILRDHGFEIEYPIEKTVTVNDVEYVVKGRVDAWREDTGEVVEIKTARSGQGVPHEHHIMQLLIYLNILKARQGVLIYITPDRLIEYTVMFQEVNLEKFVEEVVNDSRHPRWDWECRYCIFNKLCPYRVSG